MKVLLLDADGVVFKKGELFSEKYCREYGVEIEQVVEFFKGPYLDCQKGTADLKEEIKPFLEKWGWEKSVDDFLNYWFADTTLDEEMSGILTELKAKGVRVYIASNNEKYRAKKMEEILNTTKLFAGYYFSPNIKCRKEDSAFFKFILGDLEVPASEVVFVDNDQKNIDSAERVGIESYFYDSETMAKLLEKTN